MDVQQTSTSYVIPNLIRTPDRSVKENSYIQLESVDYNRLCSEQAQLQSQNQHQDQLYVHSGQLVSMSGVIENGQFVPIQLNTMPRSISNNSIRHSGSLYQLTNENQLNNPSVIAYHRSPPITSNVSPLAEERTKRGHHDVSSSIDNEEGWQTALGYTKTNRGWWKTPKEENVEKN